MAVGLAGCGGSSDGAAKVARSTTTGGSSTTGSTAAGSTTLGSTASTTTTTTTAAAGPPSDAAWAALAKAVSGGVVRAPDRGYDTDRLLFNPSFDRIHPSGIAHCAKPEEVAACLAFAQEHQLPFSVRGGGHSFGGYSTSAGLVIDQAPMSQVVAHGDGTATIGAGARLIDVYAGLAASGVMIPAGSCPTVGIAGLTLGGGVGVVSRKYGLTIDSLRGATVVLADGRVVTCDERHEPDLFWALRGGGGGNFGVVTSFDFATHPAPDVTVGGMHWPWSAAADVLSAWLDWAPHAPDELWSNCLALTQAQRGPGIEPTVRVGAAYLGSTSGLHGLFDDLVAKVGRAPSSRTGSTKGWLAAMQYEGGCSDLSVGECRLPSQGPAGRLQREGSVARAEYFSTKPSAAGIQVLVDAVAARQADPGLSGVAGVAFDAYGGAIGRVARDATAFVHRNPLCGVLLNGTFQVGEPASAADANRRWVDDLGRKLAPYVDGEAYQNYIDPSRADWARAYYGSNLARLQAVKRHYDPADAFRFAQSIPLR